ncbi:MAG: hypothetical protein MSK63_10080 [Clostridiales bacterium]|nr:hypothetical protein [Clostridiales bacterium]
MNYSYEGIGQWCATFAGSQAEEGQVVKLTAGKTVGPCAAGDGFCGVVQSVSRDGEACTVALGGMVQVAYTGTAPALGWSGLSANGTGGVKADSVGHSYLVVDVDSTGGTVTFVL